MRVNGSMLFSIRARAWIFRLAMLVHVVVMCVLSYWISLLWLETIGVLLYHARFTWADATLIASMAGFLIGLLALLWIFSRSGLLRTWCAAAGLFGLSVLAVWGVTKWL